VVRWAEEVVGRRVRKHMREQRKGKGVMRGSTGYGEVWHKRCGEGRVGMQEGGEAHARYKVAKW